MSRLLRLPVVRFLHKRQLLFPTIVVLVVAGVLVQGSLDRNPQDNVTGESISEETVPPIEPRPVIRADLEKTPLTYQSDYWNQLAEGARENLVAIGPSATAAVLIGPHLALTTADVAREVLAERRRAMLTRDVPEPESWPEESAQDPVPRASGGSAANVSLEEGSTPRLRAWNEEIGLALFDVAGVGEQAFTLSDPRGLSSGSYLGAVTLNGNGDATIAPGYLVTAVGKARSRGIEESESNADSGDLVVAMALPPTLSAAAVLDLDGAMVGFAYSTPNGPRVVTSTMMLALVDALQGETVCRSIEVSSLTEEVRRRLGLEGGVLVEYVVAEAFAPEPSLRPGDVLLEWGGTPLESVEQFMELYDAQSAGSLVRYRVLRRQRRATGGTVMPARDCAPVRPEPVRLPRFGLAVTWMPADDANARGDNVSATSGWRVVAVAPDGPAGVAGVQEQDWLLSVDDRSVDDSQDRFVLEGAAASEEPLLFALRRGGRAKLVAVPPPDPKPAETDGVLVETDVEASR